VGETFVPPVQASAGTRTESSLPLRQRRWQCKVLLAAPFTVHLDGASRPAVDEDDGLARLDPVPVSHPCAMAIAGVATRDEVIRIIIRRIPVEMVGKQRPGHEMTTSHPVDLGLAPVTPMRTGSDLFVQHNATNREGAARRSKRMLREAGHPVGDAGAALSFSSVASIAVSGTESTGPRLDLRDVGLPAANAGEGFSVRCGPLRGACSRAATPRRTRECSKALSTLGAFGELHAPTLSQNHVKFKGGLLRCPN
jgi:hypothetical protein